MDKQYILGEIKRTAEANGGIPLGLDRFFKETGIKKYDWYGKFWARWGEAVKEAGFAPNQLQRAYDEQVLIEKFISFMREIGKFPVESEIRMKGSQDKNFPNKTTFQARFGTKRQMAQKIIEYCKKNKEFEDVIEMSEAVLESQLRYKDDENITEDIVIGFVYLVKSGKYYKIGRSNAAGRREYELAIQLPEKGETVHTIRTDDPSGIEGYWHKRFEAKRKNGEWFELNSGDVRAFKRRKYM